MIQLLARSCKVAIAALLGAMPLFTTSPVVLSYVISSPLLPAVEALCYIFVYLFFVGAAVGVYERAHFNIPFLADRLKAGTKKTIRSVSAIILGAFLLFLVVYG